MKICKRCKKTCKEEHVQEIYEGDTVGHCKKFSWTCNVCFRNVINGNKVCCGVWVV